MASNVIYDGAGSTLIFSKTKLEFEIISIQPPQKKQTQIDVTGVNNKKYKTSVRGKLIAMSGAQFVVQGDMKSLQIESFADNEEITVTYPNGATYKFWGYVAEVNDGNLAVDSVPSATLVLGVSNRDESGAEKEPTFTDATA